MTKIGISVLVLSVLIPLTLFSQPNKTILLPAYELKGKIKPDIDYSIWLPQQLQEKLQCYNSITVVERRKLNAVLREQALSQTGIIEEGAAIKAGRMIGAQKIILGEFEINDKNSCSINTRLVDIEKGNVEGQWIITEIKKKKIDKYLEEVSKGVVEKIKNQVALENIAKLENKDAKFQVSVSTEKNSYKFGEVLNIGLTANKNCYAYLFDIGTSGKIHLLFPNKNQPNNTIPANQKIKIGNILVGPPEGVEMVKVIATLDSITLGRSNKNREYNCDVSIFGR